MNSLALIISLVALFLGAFCAWQNYSLNKLKKIFFSGAQAQNLESVIYALKNEIKTDRDQIKNLEENLINLRNNSTFAIQKVGLVRFNPFDDGGGNFSFSLALMDAHNCGVVITSMHGRQQNRIYTKKLESGKSDTQLSEEEIQAIDLANTKFQKT